MRLLLIISLFLSSPCFSQCKTYRITSSGDTLNCTDFKNQRQGKWIVRIEELRGEPGYEEEGKYVNNLKEGKWRRYSLMGDLQAVENYRWGYKDGPQQYFYMNELEHEESWRSVNPSKQYDTLDVPDLYDPDKYVKKIIKIDAYSQKHGVWKYYLPGSMSLIRTETYLFDSLYKPVPADKPIKTTATAADTTKPALVKPKQVQDFEKKNAGKKLIKIRDGSTSN